MSNYQSIVETKVISHVAVLLKVGTFLNLK